MNEGTVINFAQQAENARLRGTLFDVYVRIEKMQDICTANAEAQTRRVAT